MDKEKRQSNEKIQPENENISTFPEWFSKIWHDKGNADRRDNSLEDNYKSVISKMKYALEKTALISLINKDGNIIYASESFCKKLQYEEEELTGEHYLSLQHRSFFLKAPESFSDALKTKDYRMIETVPKTKSGNPIIFQTLIFPLLENNKETEVFLFLHHDMTRLKQAERTIKELVTVDALTGLQNREKFEQDTMAQMELNEGKDYSFAVFFIDLDRFKFYNDTLGHATGDKLIQSIAQTLMGIKYKELQLYRYGGDEFSIIVHKPKSKEDIQAIAEEILDVFKSPFLINGNELFITASIGMSYYPELGKTYEEIVQQAEMAMHYAKERGKNDFQWYHPSIRTEHDEKLLIEKRLRLATEKKDFTIHYQPQIDLKKKMVIGVEALIRWEDELIGQVSPGVFIPIAEEAGLINPIGDWVLEEASRQAKIWHEQGYPLRMGINISPIQFQRPDFVSKVKTILSKTELSPKLLDLEITENDLLYNRGESFKTLERLKEIGISISIDDFGTGYSSLSYLRKFPIDTLKIDKSFITDVIENSNDQAIVTSIIQLAHNMHLKVIAEGVETAEMVMFLNEHECDEMQGFLYSKPLPAEEVTKFIKRTNPRELLKV